MAAEQLHVLAIDDDPHILEIMQEALGGSGYRVSIADGGAAGLARAQQLRPDVILLDMDMPGLDGLQVLRALREKLETAAIPALSADASRASGASGRGSG